MRKALVVGIDCYQSVSALTGCVADAHAVKNVLERHSDGSVNFATPRLMVAGVPNGEVTKNELKAAVRELFASEAEIALFYFAGHGYIEDTGGFLCASDCQNGDDGLSLNEVMALANDSPAQNRVVILDSCHSGVTGSRVGDRSVAEIKDGMTVLTASTAEQFGLDPVWRTR